MNIRKIAAFSDGIQGGNPAGVVLCQQFPSTDTMQSMAAEVGFSETVFAYPISESPEWRVRYFSPETEVPFCGHATIALGAALADQFGNTQYHLRLNHGHISVTGTVKGTQLHASLISPRTQSNTISRREIDATLDLFGYQPEQLDECLAPARISAGANHYVLALNTPKDLSAMHYSLDEGRKFMHERGLTTIMLVHSISPQHFLARNAFAAGGVLEDPATGAAAAAFMGYLRDLDWPNSGRIMINQGDDMGAPSHITAEYCQSSDLDAQTITATTGDPIKLSGLAHYID